MIFFKHSSRIRVFTVRDLMIRVRVNPRVLFIHILGKTDLYDARDEIFTFLALLQRCVLFLSFSL